MLKTRKKNQPRNRTESRYQQDNDAAVYMMYVNGRIGTTNTTHEMKIRTKYVQSHRNVFTHFHFMLFISFVHVEFKEYAPANVVLSVYTNEFLSCILIDNSKVCVCLQFFKLFSLAHNILLALEQ